jgi:hypothetical protein
MRNLLIKKGILIFGFGGVILTKQDLLIKEKDVPHKPNRNKVESLDMPNKEWPKLDLTLVV